MFFIDIPRRIFEYWRSFERMRKSSSLGRFQVHDPSNFQANLNFDSDVDPKSSSLFIGKDSLISCSIFFEKSNSTLFFGNYTAVNGGTIIAVSNEIVIGNNVWISYECLIMDNDGHSKDPRIRRQDLPDLLNEKLKDWSEVHISPIKIEDDVWVGARSIILKGVTIGRCSIVGAGAVVTKNVPPYTIVAGNPAIVVGSVPR